MELQHPDPEPFQEPRGFSGGVADEPRVDRAHRDQPVLVAPHEVGDPVVHAIGKTHDLGRHIVDQGCPFDRLLVHQPEQLLRAPPSPLDPLEVVARAAGHDGERLGLQLLPRLDVDVAVEDPHENL